MFHLKEDRYIRGISRNKIRIYIILMRRVIFADLAID